MRTCTANGIGTNGSYIVQKCTGSRQEEEADQLSTIVSVQFHVPVPLPCSVNKP